MEASSQDFQPITPPRSRIVSGIGWILAFIWNILAFIYTWYNKIIVLIFYRAPLRLLRSRGVEIWHLHKIYLYAKLIGKSFYLLPWATLTIWYLTVCVACGWPKTRPHMDSICLRPYTDPSREQFRWFDYWDTAADNDDTPDTLSESDEVLMIGYLDILDAAAVLRRRALELEDLACTNCSRLLTLLCKLLALVACLISS